MELKQNLKVHFAFQQLKHVHLLGRTLHLLKHQTLRLSGACPKVANLKMQVTTRGPFTRMIPAVSVE